jgi:talin
MFMCFYRQLQNELQQLASEVGESSLQVVSSTSNPAKLANESKHFGNKTVELINTGTQLAALHEDIEVREEIVITLKNISIATSNLLIQTKAASSNPDAPGMRNQLTSAARYGFIHIKIIMYNFDRIPTLHVLLLKLS